MPIQIKERVMYDITDLDIGDVVLLKRALRMLLTDDELSEEDNNAAASLIDGLNAVEE